ncbi:protein CFAP20DC-like [Leucoraja erinacea]|uniref:protein CFAP20DC-like n=1 Tax=Leucoraja erinaceus TaxID=7782 RepID=UPI0024568C83|nr:protein CFAP20DC-like [Leucoraja erinacea]
MFKGEYQGGAFVEIFSSQGKDPVAKWKLCGNPTVQKVFDKEVKSYVYILEGSCQRNKMQLPKDSKHSLGLIQRFLVLQLCVPVGQDFSTELLITDLGNIKRRLYLSTIHKEFSTTPLHAKIPLSIIKRKIWSNVCIDMVSFASAAFKGTGFQFLDRIIVSANCKLRKIFTMKFQPLDTTFEDDMYSLQCISDGPTDMIPKCCQLAIDIDQVTQLLNVVKLKRGELRIGSQQLASADLDQPSSRGIVSARSVRNQDISHIAFGSKVPGPPPAISKKVGTTAPKDVSSQKLLIVQILVIQHGNRPISPTCPHRPTSY